MSQIGAANKVHATQANAEHSLAWIGLGCDAER